MSPNEGQSVYAGVPDGHWQHPNGSGLENRDALLLDTKPFCPYLLTIVSGAMMTLVEIRPALFAIALLSSGAVHASPELAKSRNCVACHAVDKKLIGPSYKDIAAKYASDKDAVTQLAKKVRAGSVGVWGQIPMPANPQVSPDDAITLVTWVLSAK